MAAEFDTPARKKAVIFQPNWPPAMSQAFSGPSGAWLPDRLAVTLEQKRWRLAGYSGCSVCMFAARQKPGFLT
jgi:hypothetical protein